MIKGPNNIRISVIIPVFNARAYINHCINSLKEQTFKELEFIFVDDCSEDESIEIVKDWAKVDARVRILENEKNMGEGASRNRGLEAAQGEYINTIDPDDWVAPDFYELLYKKAEETSADIVKGTRIKIEEDTMQELEPRSELNDKITSCLAKGEPLYLRLNYEHTTIIFKRSLCDETIQYGKSVNAADTTFLLKLCTKAKSLAIEDHAYYYYLQRKDSATAKYSLKRSYNELISLSEQIDFLLEKNSWNAYDYEFCAKRCHAYISRFIHAYESGLIKPQEREQYIEEFKALLTRIPNYTNLYKYDLKIFALIELHKVLANGLCEDSSICKEEIADWIAYACATDGEVRQKVCKKITALLTNYLKKKNEAGISFEESQKEILQMEYALEDLNQKMLFQNISKEVLNKFTKKN